MRCRIIRVLLSEMAGFWKTGRFFKEFYGVEYELNPVCDDKCS